MSFLCALGMAMTFFTDVAVAFSCFVSAAKAGPGAQRSWTESNARRHQSRVNYIDSKRRKKRGKGNVMRTVRAARTFRKKMNLFFIRDDRRRYVESHGWTMRHKAKCGTRPNAVLQSSKHSCAWRSMAWWRNTASI